MNIYFAKKKCSLDGWEGKFFNGKNYKIFREDVDIYCEENHQLLCKFRKNVLSDKETQQMMKCKGAAKSGYSRPSASGFESKETKYKYILSKSTGKKLHVLTSKSTSGIIGFYDCVSNFGYTTSKSINPCRMTAFTSKNLGTYQECLPIFQKINRLFKTLVPCYYKNQLRASNNIATEFIIPKTVFTTITVNKNFRTALHKDVGDLKDGFGIMVVVSDNDVYKGSYTLFPEYKIAIDCRNGDFLAFDVHQWHCNSEMSSADSSIRLSFIFYLREKMLNHCPMGV
jgi:hypothetical protein